MHSLPILNIRSIDFDGCLFNEEYEINRVADKGVYQNMICANEPIIKAITESIHEDKANEVRFMIGSNRQSLSFDLLNDGTSVRKGSCFVGIGLLVDEIKKTHPHCTFDSYLVADSYADQKEGAAFEAALATRNALELNTAELAAAIVKAEKNDAEFFKDHAEWLFDDSKVTLLYAQMHHAASSRKGYQVVFDFYDDRLDILNALEIFYSQNPKLLPKNFKLRLHHYQGLVAPKPFEEKSIKSNAESFTDENYAKTLRNYAKKIGCTNVKTAGGLVDFVDDMASDVDRFIAARDEANPVKKKVTFANTNLKQSSAIVDFFNMNLSTAEDSASEVGDKEGIAVTPTSSIASSSFSGSPSLADHSFSSTTVPVTPSSSLTEEGFFGLETPYAQFIKARDLLIELSNVEMDGSIYEAAVNVLKAVNSIKNPTVDERLMQTRVLTNTAALMQNPGDVKLVNTYTAMLTDLSRTNRTWTRIIGGAAVVFLGVVLIAASIAAAVLTKGFAIPLTIKGTEFGVGLVALGVAIATGIALGAGLSGIFGVYCGAKYVNEGLNNRRVAGASGAFWQVAQVKRQEQPELKEEKNQTPAKP